MKLQDVKPGDVFASDKYEAVVIGTPTPESIDNMSILASLELKAGKCNGPKIAPGILCYKGDFIQICEFPVPDKSYRELGFLTLNEDKFPDITQDYKGQDAEASKRLLTYALRSLEDRHIYVGGILGHQLNLEEVERKVRNLLARSQ